MFQFTIILLPSIDDILKFFTELRTNPVDSFVFLFAKIFDLIIRIIKHLLIIPIALFKIVVFKWPKGAVENYYSLLEFALKTIPFEMGCYNKKRRFLAILEA